MAVMSERTCPRCNETKPLEEFTRNRSRANGRGTYCRPCMNDYRKAQIARDPEADRAYRREWWHRNPEKTSQYKRKFHLSQYGLTIQEFDALLLRQGGGCAVCDRRPEEFRNGLYVDHDHATGEVRGLLCECCNFALGQLGDDIQRVQRLASYLQSPSAKVVM